MKKELLTNNNGTSIKSWLLHITTMTAIYILLVLGTVLLIDGIYKKSDEGNIFTGRTYMDAPEIDSRVFIKSDKDIYGKFLDIEIEGLDGYDFLGKIWRE